jgi:GH24 family phage-related lysozyme (muramidase)
MRISNRGIRLIKRYEGVRLKAYKPVPTEVHWTIGYGHYGPDVRRGQVITEAQAEKLLRADLRKFELGVTRLLKTRINQNRFDALVSLAFNIGLGAFAESTVLRETNRRRFKRAAAAFGMWVKGGGRVLPGLVKRRASEAWLYARPVRKKR